MNDLSWVTYCSDDMASTVFEFDSCFEPGEELSRDEDSVSVVPVNLILPDELLERIIALLPVVSILRAESVCKRWREIVISRKSTLNAMHAFPQRPWYYMFTGSEDPAGYAHDPILQRWYPIRLPAIENANYFTTSSHGLVCFMDMHSRRKLYVSNPITKSITKLEQPPGIDVSDYASVSISVDPLLHHYTVSIVRSKQAPEAFHNCELAIHVYASGSRTWMTYRRETLSGWRGGDESVICGGFLYMMVYATGNIVSRRHGLIMYNLSQISSGCMLIESFIPVPCHLTCGRLMNMKEKLVMVGGIGKHDHAGIIKGISIWVLKGREWCEIARMPRKFFHGFGEFDDVFASSGTGELIYVQSYGSPALLSFDMNQKQWTWSQKCPVSKKFPLQLFTGFCFEPRLEISP